MFMAVHHVKCSAKVARPGDPETVQIDRLYRARQISLARHFILPITVVPRNENIPLSSLRRTVIEGFFKNEVPTYQIAYGENRRLVRSSS